jgi:GNAT superfamily N-acetyltransferase
MEYSFIKDYKHDLKSRASFCRLAKDTFGIDFDGWFSQGYWNENYICYSMEYGGEIISNVSVNLIRLIMDGRETDAVQIGTVMTHPEHRRRGLAKSLLERAIGDFSGRYTFFFLAADKAAVPLYESCGFETARTYKNEIDLAGYRRAAKALESVEVQSRELLEAKRASMPLVAQAVGQRRRARSYVLLSARVCFAYLQAVAGHIVHIRN